MQKQKWKNEIKLDKVKRKYIKWILGLEKGIPNYNLLLVKETKIELGSNRRIIMRKKQEDPKKKRNLLNLHSKFEAIENNLKKFDEFTYLFYIFHVFCSLYACAIDTE